MAEYRVEGTDKIFVNDLSEGGTATGPLYVDDGVHAAVGIGTPSSANTAALLVEELVVGAGIGVFPGDVVVWSDDATIVSSPAIENQTTIAGVAMEEGAPGAKIKVCRRGRVATNLAGGDVATGTLLGTTTSVGACGGTNPPAGAILGRAAGAGVGGGVICDVTLG